MLSFNLLAYSDSVELSFNNAEHFSAKVNKEHKVNHASTKKMNEMHVNKTKDNIK